MDGCQGESLLSRARCAAPVSVSRADLSATDIEDQTPAFWSPRRGVWALIGVTLVLRLVWASTLELGNDEAYHYLYTVHPDWSYFDHPPMLAWIAAAGRALCGGWVHPLSLRLGFVLLFAGSTWVLYDWTSRWFGERAGFYAALVLNLSGYLTAAAGAFVLPDGPFLFFALLTMRALSQALFGAGRPVVAWVQVGLACAGAIASKYHGIFLPLGTLAYVVVTPRAWPILRTPGPYLASLLGACGMIPTLIWNSQHDWASIAFQGGRALGAHFQPAGLAIMVFGTMGYLFPWIWAPSLAVLGARVKRLHRLDGIERFLVCLSLVPLALFFCVSCVRPILPHWPLIGFVPLFLLVGEHLTRQADLRPTWVRRWLAFMGGSVIVIPVVFACQARLGIVDLPVWSDPAREISGWQSVGAQLEARGLVDRRNTFLFTEHWFDSGQLAFSVRNRIPVTCYKQNDARGFAFWSRPSDWVGKDGLFVCADRRPDLEVFTPYFRSVELLAEFPMTRSGKPFRPVQVYLCKDQQTPFPFAYPQRNSIKLTQR